MKKYKSKLDHVFSDEDAKIIGEYLASEFPNGIMEKGAVLEKAKNHRSPIHKYFDWDDTSAARKYRLLQERKLITCYMVVIEDVPMPGNVSIKMDRRVYMNTEQARQSPDIWDEVVRDAKEGLFHWKMRYQNLKTIESLRGVFGEIDKLEEYENEEEKPNRGSKKASRGKERGGRKDNDTTA